MAQFEEMTGRYNIMWRKWAYIASYARDRHRTKIISAEYDPHKGDITCNFTGKSGQTLFIYTFRDEDENVEYSLHPLSDFDGSTTLVISENRSLNQDP